MSINFHFNNKALESFVQKYDLEKTKVDVNGKKVKVDYDGDGRYDETINFSTKDIKYSYKEYEKGNTDTINIGKYTVIDYDGDGRYDAKIKTKKLTKDNMSNPITLDGSSREVQELTEQRFALQYAYSAAISREVPDLKEGQKIKKLIAEIDKKLAKYNAGVGTDEFNTRLDGLYTEEKAPAVDEPQEEAPAPLETVKTSEEEAPAAELPTEVESEEETGFKKGSEIKVTNPNNPNGTIDGRLEDFEQNADGMITKFTIKSEKSGNTFTYEYDPATKRYVNKAENKYYIMTEDGTLIRDNKLGVNPPVVEKDEIIEQSRQKAETITMKDVKPYGKGKFIDKDGNIYELGKNGKFVHVGCANPDDVPFFVEVATSSKPQKSENQPSAEALKNAQSTFRSGGKFEVVKMYPDGSFDMKYDFGSWWNGGSGVRHYDKNGGLLGRPPKAEEKSPAKTETDTNTYPQPSAEAVKKAQSTYRSGMKFEIVKTYADGSFDMKYDGGSWWNGGSGVRHYDKDGGLLGGVAA